MVDGRDKEGLPVSIFEGVCGANSVVTVTGGGNSYNSISSLCTSDALMVSLFSVC